MLREARLIFPVHYGEVDPSVCLTVATKAPAPGPYGGVGYVIVHGSWIVGILGMMAGRCFYLKKLNTRVWIRV